MRKRWDEQRSEPQSTHDSAARHTVTNNTCSCTPRTGGEVGVVAPAEADAELGHQLQAIPQLRLNLQPFGLVGRLVDWLVEGWGGVW